MENTVHLFEEGYYLLSNRSVATSPMFLELEDCNIFRSKINAYLSPICDVMAYAFLPEEFQLVIRLKSRDIIEEYFLDKYSKKSGEDNSEIFIPETTYIIAQAMANLQSGYVKRFNFKNERDGGLMASRFKRLLIESENQLDQIIDQVNAMEKIHRRKLIWAYREKRGFGYRKGSRVWSSSFYYSNLGTMDDAPVWFKIKSDIYLRGHFENIPLKRIKFKNDKEKIRNFLSFIFKEVIL